MVTIVLGVVLPRNKDKLSDRFVTLLCVMVVVPAMLPLFVEMVQTTVYGGNPPVNEAVTVALPGPHKSEEIRLATGRGLTVTVLVQVRSPGWFPKQLSALVTPVTVKI